VNLLKLHSRPAVEVQTLFDPPTILDLQSKLPHVYGDDSLYDYIVQLAEESRRHPDVALGASPRAALNMLKCARARAVLEGRHYFTHDDVQAVAYGVLGHRLILRPEAEIEGKHVADVVREVLAAVQVFDVQ
jgi:MoxR-like ATPase